VCRTVSRISHIPQVRTKRRSLNHKLTSADAPAFPSGAQVQEYIESYATHFELQKYTRLNTSVTSITRNAHDTKWIVHLLGLDQVEQTIEFDKVAICSGAWTHPRIPEFEGREKFQGTFIHSKNFKRPEDFKGKTVLVIGIGNSSADISTSLVGHAAGIYLSHRHGANLVRLCLPLISNTLTDIGTATTG
jgi:dimethylaniline monooxygenase (N-oxide forming)